LRARSSRLRCDAAEQGPKLIVGINPDSSPGGTVPASMRIEALQSINLVSDAILAGEIGRNLHRAAEVCLHRFAARRPASSPA
jgi:hypothetical protein